MKKLTVLTLAIILLFSCTNNEKTSEQYKITTSIIPLTSITKSIVGDEFDIQNLVPSGVSPHSFDLKTEDMVNLENSDLIISIGLDSIDGFLDKINKNIFKVSEKIDLLKKSDSGKNESYTVDPHIWNSPKNAEIIAQNIKTELTKLKPEKKELFDENYNNFVSSLTEIKNSFLEETNGKTVKYFIVFHDAYSYMFNELGIPKDKEIVFKTSVLDDPDSTEMKDIIDSIEKYDIKIAFVEPQFQNGNLEKLAEEYNIQIFILDPLGEDGSAKGYLENLQTNLDSLKNIYE